MKHISKLVLVLSIISLFSNSVAFGHENSKSATAQKNERNEQEIRKRLSEFNFPFTANPNPLSEVKFTSKLNRGNLYITNKGKIVYNFNNSITPIAFSEEFNTNKEIYPVGKDASKTTYSDFTGNDKNKWRSEIAAFDSLDLGEVFDGINAHLKIHGKNVEKIFTVSPNANPDLIKLKFTRVDNISLEENGELKISKDQNSVNFSKPVAFQEINGKKVDVDIDYTLLGNLSYGFKLGKYDHNYELTIDPLLSATVLGGSNYESTPEVYGGTKAIVIATDPNDNQEYVYVTGMTDMSPAPTTAFPTLSGPLGTGGGGSDVFVSKFNLGLTSLVASTRLGGTSDDYEAVIAADANGNIFVGGNTNSTNFPTTAGAYDTSDNPSGDGFITKLPPALTSITASTYIGGNTFDHLDSLTINQTTGRVYAGLDVSSATTSAFPTTAGAYDTSANSGSSNIAIASFDNNLSNTSGNYIGTWWGTNGYYPSIAIDSNNKVFVMVLNHTAGAIIGTPYQSTSNGLSEITVARFNDTLSTLEASTYFGSAGQESYYTNNIVVGPDNSVIIGADTNNAASMVSTHPGDVTVYCPGGLTTNCTYPIFVTKFDNNLSTAKTALYGANGGESGVMLGVDTNNNIYAGTSTFSTNIPTTVGAYDETPNDAGAGDVAIMRFSPNMELETLSYLGGSNYDSYAYGVDFDASNNVYFYGETTSSDFPTTAGAYDTTQSGGDVFITKFSEHLTYNDAVTDLASTGSTGTSVDLNWSTPTSYTNITEYEIHYGTTAGGCTPTNINDADCSTLSAGTNTTATVSGLTTNQEYLFTVYGRGPTSNQRSPSSNSVAVTPFTAAAPPTLANPIPLFPSLKLTWNAEPGATSYKVYYGPTATFPTSASTRTTTQLGMILTDIPADTSYSYYVTNTVAATESAPSNTQTYTLETPPALLASFPLNKLIAVSPYDMNFDSSGYLWIASSINNRIAKYDLNSMSELLQIGLYGSLEGEFSSPKGVSTDSSGNIYVADTSNNRIQKFDSNGNFLLAWGTSGSANGQLSLPVAIDISSTDTIYVLEQGNNRVSMFNTSGSFLGKWGTFGSGNGQFFTPTDLQLDSGNNVYVMDYVNNRVQKFNSAGVYLTQWGSYGTGNGQFFQAFHLAIDNSDNIYVSDTGNFRVQKFNSSGTYLNQFGSSGNADGQFASRPDAITVDSSGNIYVSDSNNRVQKFDSSFNFVAQLGTETNFDGNNSIGYTWGTIGFDSSNNIYVPDANLNIIQKFDSSGNFISQFGTAGSGDGELNIPTAAIVDTSGNIYVSDYGNHRIQKFNSAGVYLSQWGTPGTADGELDEPNGLAMDSSGNIYVADSNNHRIQKFTNNGVHLASYGTYGTGNGEYSYPTSVGIDSNNNIYVLDVNNARVQKLDSSGNYLTQWGTFGSEPGQFYTPTHLGVDPYNNHIYVLDGDNANVQEFTDTGTLVRSWGYYGAGDYGFYYPEGLGVNANTGDLVLGDSNNYRVNIYDTFTGSRGSTSGCTSSGGNVVCGTQNLQCPTLANAFGTGTTAPANFQIGDDGSRSVSSSNDTSFTPTLNASYFDNDNDATYNDTTDEFTFNSNTPLTCGGRTKAVQLTVSATPFTNGLSQNLISYGTDGTASGTGTDADYYAMLSVITSGNTTCSTGCVLAEGAVESNNGIKHGEGNFFASASLGTSTHAAGFDIDSILVDEQNALNTVTLYSNSAGFEGEIPVPGLQYNLAMPANPVFSGSFTSTVTYTLSA